MSTQRSRIGMLALGFLLAGLVVIVHLWIVMVGDHGVWAARSHENRSSFRSVPSLRGAIRDRNGTVLAHDEATMQVSLFYLRFRSRHPVGAAVHGATAWARLQPGRALTTYGYEPGVLGPEAAARDLMAMPTIVLRRGRLDKRYASTIAKAVTTLLSGTTGMPRNKVYAALRREADSGSGKTCGDALPGFTTADLLTEYDRILGALRWFDDELSALPASSRSSSLFAKLERLRNASLEEETVTWTTKDEDGKEVEHTGDPYENIAWPFAEEVPFQLAAGLRTGKTSHAGLEVRPSVRRICTEPLGTSMRSLLGRVMDVGRSQPDAQWIDRYMQRKLPDDWLDELVPEQATDNDEARQRMQGDAETSFKRLTKQYERRGESGIEAAWNDVLAGRLGFRLVERDSKQREQLMWSSLRVQSGDDVTLSIDADLQRIAEGLVRRAYDEVVRSHGDEDDKSRVEAALAVIDARTGDVLAFAGAPVRGSSARQVPGVWWSGNGALGSVVKPFVLVEQLVSEALGRPHQPMSSFEPCTGTFHYGRTPLGCVRSGHWDEGKDPVAALAKSCNAFFYQAAQGLGEQGVALALQRFGLSPSAPGSATEHCWQPRVPGFPWRAPSVSTQHILPRRAIGYGVQASPLAVARAYAGLATGRLPTLGLLTGEPRRSVELAGLGAELQVVRQGLAACVQSGTARIEPRLAEFRVLGKTGTAEVGTRDKENNAWFAGFLPEAGRGGAQLCFCSVVYWVPDGIHGADAGRIIADLLATVSADPQLAARYLP